jgi:hypothetical protein
MLGSLDRFVDDEIPAEPSTIGDLRAFFLRWQRHLRAETPERNAKLAVVDRNGARPCRDGRLRAR